MRKSVILWACLILSGASFAAPAPITNVSAGVNGAPPYILQSLQVGSYTVAALITGTTTSSPSVAQGNVDDFDLNTYATGWAYPLQTVLFGGQNFVSTNGSDPDFFLFESTGSNNPDDVAVTPIFPDGTLGTAYALPTTIAANGWGNTGLQTTVGGANPGQVIAGVCWDITDMQDAAGNKLSPSAVIKGISITQISGGLDVCGFFAAAVVTPPSDLSGNGKVDMEDFGILSRDWQDVYEMADLLRIADDWLLITDVAFKSDTIVEKDAAQGVAYSSTLTDDLVVFDASQLTFSKLNGPGWLTVAADGSLSGTPAGSDAGINGFMVQVESLSGSSDWAALVINIPGNSSLVKVVPAPYTKGLRNPLMGITTRGVYDHPWATLAHTYIRWNEIENYESDTIEKIRTFCNSKWSNVQNKNIKVIPRVYLHWDGTSQYWPADMTAYDYESEQFKQRVLRLIERLGLLWDNDPRVAFVEMGIFGKWGEQEQPAAIPEIDALVADAFAAAFKNKLVSVRENWEMYQSQPFGEYWDSWAHYDQMWPHGNGIALLNAQTGRHLVNYVGGEVAYGWGSSAIQPGDSPTDTVTDPVHRDFMINSIRWLHCTQLRWIDDYDRNNPQAKAGADLIQQAFGYRFVLEKVAFSPSVTDGTLRVVLNVKNEGSAKFYYNWPVEVSLLNINNRSVVWKQTFANADIRDWLSGEGWTAPQWEYVGGWRGYIPNVNWVNNGTPGWATPPQTYTVSGDFQVNIPAGQYILALAVLDPAGNLPSVRFATSQYFTGGRHPIGIVGVNQAGGPLPGNMVFDDPATDSTLKYVLP